MAKKVCNEAAINMIVNPTMDELEQLRQTTIINETCDALLPAQRKAAADIAKVLYPQAFSGKKGKEFEHKGETYQATITRKYKYPKRSRNPVIQLLLNHLHEKKLRVAELNKEKAILTRDIASLKDQLNPKMKLESETCSVSVKHK